MSNFFEHQDRAQSRTGWLVFLFVIGVLGVTISITLLTAVFMPNAIPAAIVVSLLIIGIPFVFKLLTMSSSGALVAESLGGIRINPASQETNERKILNVVEEMAIASGMPIPPVFILDEDCINAFAAGKTPQDAVIGVSRGAIESLTRDELQGVMAHEFSHIFHGDMRINMRAIAAIFGLMAIGYVGYFVLRSTMFGPRTRKIDGKAAAGIAIFGVGLIVIGCIGTFFGRLMQAAISRQREFLADASAVQYTRNPAGIGGALRKIGAQASGTMHHAEASQFNHMLFSQGINTLFASHPPLAERIKRIEAIAGGVLPESINLTPPQTPSHSHEAQTSGRTNPMAGILAANFAAVGSVSAGNLARVQAEYSSCDELLLSAAHDPDGAKAIVFVMTLSQDQTKAAAQIKIIASKMPEIENSVMKLERAAQQLSTQQRLAMIDVACATLVFGATESYKVFRTTLSESIRSDGSINLFEWVVMQILRMRVELPMAIRDGFIAPTHNTNISTVALSVQRTLGIIAFQGSDDIVLAQRAFQSALNSKGYGSTRNPTPIGCGNPTSGGSRLCRRRSNHNGPRIFTSASALRTIVDSSSTQPVRFDRFNQESL
ncbi:MAG: M48 family metallopeptidase [Planctomycetota bacterium]|nr:M48 family metallopeptidase [Planctomycetota bacterium]